MLHISQPFSCPGPTRMSLHYLERDEVNGSQAPPTTLFS